MTAPARKEKTMKPHRCPVCGGRGTVPCNFYTGSASTTSTSEVECKSCHGEGILWSYAATRENGGAAGVSQR